MDDFDIDDVESIEIDYALEYFLIYCDLLYMKKYSPGSVRFMNGCVRTMIGIRNKFDPGDSLRLATHMTLAYLNNEVIVFDDSLVVKDIDSVGFRDLLCE